jgi:hypothetical protein
MLGRGRRRRLLLLLMLKRVVEEELDLVVVWGVVDTRG